MHEYISIIILMCLGLWSRIRRPGTALRYKDLFCEEAMTENTCGAFRLYTAHSFFFLYKRVIMKRIIFKVNLTEEEMREKLAKKAKANDGKAVPPALLPAAAPARPPAPLQHHQNDASTSTHKKGANRRCAVEIQHEFLRR